MLCSGDVLVSTPKRQLEVGPQRGPLTPSNFDIKFLIYFSLLEEKLKFILLATWHSEAFQGVLSEEMQFFEQIHYFQ